MWNLKFTGNMNDIHSVTHTCTDYDCVRKTDEHL